MDRAAGKSKSPRRKLNRTQIIDILERNVALYKDEPVFVRYLIELAVYLMEFEYNWTDSDAPRPDFKTPPEREITTGALEEHARRTTEDHSAAVTTHGHSTDNERGSDTSSKKPLSILKAATLNPRHKTCLHCGADVGELLICPTCRNLTH